MNNYADLDKQIAATEATLAELKRQKADFESMSADYSLAILLHETTCHSEHTERCGWYYEFKDGRHAWTGWTHDRYLTKARDLMDRLPTMGIEQIMQVVQAIR